MPAGGVLAPCAVAATAENAPEPDGRANGAKKRPIPVQESAFSLEQMAERTGLEPATSGVTGQHSNQLNYRSALHVTAASCSTRTFHSTGVPKGIRTPVTAVKGRCPGPLDDGDAGNRKNRWWSQPGSNRRPLACHASALPAELWPLKGAREDSEVRAIRQQGFSGWRARRIGPRASLSGCAARRPLRSRCGHWNGRR